MAAPPSSAQAGLARLYQLYRQVLRVHRAKLPPPLRTLGDSYVKAEVRRHLDGKTSAAQWREFGDQWAAYVSMLAGRADADEDRGDVGRLHDAGGAALSAEQQEQLRRLQAAALELGGKGGGDGGPQQQ
ncbi:MAG: hypothetical protein J3K34DRAFT_366119 [Monoraphidium minutum]|nr:MAG: hypothetical protein J3K34DRAFT_366119 [Monoraphidium minutum]